MAGAPTRAGIETAISTATASSSLIDGVATNGQIDAFIAALFAVTPFSAATAANNNSIIYLFARYLFDNGASINQQFPPPMTLATVAAVDLTKIADLVKEHCTSLRRFLAYWSPTLFNRAVANNDPPAKWATFNYTQETRFVGFDGSNKLVEAAKYRGIALVRLLTPAELVAVETNSKVHIHRSLTGENESSTAVEITHGRYTRPKGSLLPPP